MNLKHTAIHAVEFTDMNVPNLVIYAEMPSSRNITTASIPFTNLSQLKIQFQNRETNDPNGACAVEGHGELCIAQK